MGSWLEGLGVHPWHTLASWHPRASAPLHLRLRAGPAVLAPRPSPAPWLMEPSHVEDNALCLVTSSAAIACPTGPVMFYF